MAAAQKVALITAGSAGLGAQIARALAPDFRVCINYANNQSRAQTLLDELHKIPNAATDSSSPRFHSVKADAGDRSAIKNLVDETVKTFGRLDVVVSNHGWTRVTNFQDLDDNMDDELWDRTYLYNVKSHAWLMHAAKPHLEATEGAFVTTASLAGVKPSGSSIPYAITKAAQIHMAKTFAVVCAPKVRVNCVSPGLMLTEWGMKFSEEKREAVTQSTKLKRLPTVEDVAEQVRTIVLSRSMTGQNIVIDSGQSL